MFTLRGVSDNMGTEASRDELKVKFISIYSKVQQNCLKQCVTLIGQLGFQMGVHGGPYLIYLQHVLVLRILPLEDLQAVGSCPLC